VIGRAEERDTNQSRLIINHVVAETYFITSFHLPYGRALLVSVEQLKQRPLEI
jgi:hypothetical protein